MARTSCGSSATGRPASISMNWQILLRSARAGLADLSPPDCILRRNGSRPSDMHIGAASTVLVTIVRPAPPAGHRRLDLRLSCHSRAGVLSFPQLHTW